MPIPKSLQGLDKANIIHFKATQQGPNQCGSRSVANALAVQEIINADEPLTSANIRNHAAHYDGILINQVIEDDIVANLARENHLFNAHVLAKSPKEQTGEHPPYVVYSLDTQSHSLEELIDSMLIESILTAQLICNTGGHWVLISIVKQEGKKPLILYMDSGNGQLNDNSPATSFILYLYEHCIA